jgi:methionyl-tRNA formyltransferase
MRVLLITQGMSRLVKPLFASQHEVVGVVESMPRDFNLNRNGRFLLRVAKKIYLLIKGKPLNLKSFCNEKTVPYNFICKGRDKIVEDWAKELQPDLIVVFSTSQLIKESLISIPKYGAINLHPSFLPEYRGANPDFWQYHDLVMNPGVTVHYIDKGEDTGDIILQERVHIALGTKSPERLDKLIGEIGVPLMLNAIEKIEDGTAPRIKQPENSPTPRARNLTKDEHGEIIDWINWPIERIWHVLRGTELWLNAFEQPSCIFKGHRWQVGDFVKQKNKKRPGSLVRFEGKRAVAASDGFVFLTVKFRLKNAILGLLK